MSLNTFVTAFFTILYIVLAHDEDVYTIKYTTENFSLEVPKKNHFIMFYAPWCGHCQKFAPTWEQLAEMLNEDDNNIKIAKVDCTTENQVCSEQDVTGYPTLKFFKVGDSEGVRFRGTRDLPSLTTFINEQLREGEAASEVDETPQAIGGLFELTEDNFDAHVASGKHFIKFYAPWCGHCQMLAPTWEQLAKTVDTENVQIGKIDCTKYRVICTNFEIKGYPTLLWIEDGKKLDKYQGDRTQEALKQYVLNMLGSNIQVPEEESSSSEETTGELTVETFKEGVRNGIAFVKFFAPWCGHCKRLSPTWDSLRTKYSGKNGVNIFKVDCNSDENKQLCAEEEVEGFPTLFLYKDGQKISEYSGSRSLEDLSDFVNKHLVHDEL